MNSVDHIPKIHHANQLKVEMKINNQNIHFEVDTGLGITLISVLKMLECYKDNELISTNGY